MYLEEPDSYEGEAGGDSAAEQGGGHTIFPFASPSGDLDGLDGVTYAGAADAPACRFPNLAQRRGLMVRPRRGEALLFYTQSPDGALDGRTRHGACPVTGGRKVAANLWVWNRRVIYR